MSVKYTSIIYLKFAFAGINNAKAKENYIIVSVY